jgi:hypothetical protein
VESTVIGGLTLCGKVEPHHLMITEETESSEPMVVDCLVSRDASLSFVWFAAW